MVKNMPAVQESWAQSLGWEDPLVKGITIHSSTLAQETPWTEGPDRLWCLGLQSQTQLKRLSM